MNFRSLLFIIKNVDLVKNCSKRSGCIFHGYQAIIATIFGRMQPFSMHKFDKISDFCNLIEPKEMHLVWHFYWKPTWMHRKGINTVRNSTWQSILISWLLEKGGCIFIRTNKWVLSQTYFEFIGADNNYARLSAFPDGVHFMPLYDDRIRKRSRISKCDVHKNE